jgi:uncharacterized protein YutE (UPF0331/DUF86 family)
VLRGLAATPPHEFLDNPDKVGNAKYHFIIAIECCIDVANHIIASEDLPFPKDNAGSFSVIIDAGLLDEELRDPLRAMARFRNRLVHLYWDIDDARVYEYLQDSLTDLERFAQRISDAFAD